MQKQVLGLLVLVTLSLAACPANYNINNLVADSVALAVTPNGASSSQSFVYNFAQKFANTPAIALGLQDFSVNYVGAGSFAVYPSSVSSSQASLQFESGSSVWTRVRVNFWASTNSQLQLGNFKVDNIQTLGSCNCALAYANINTPFAQNDNPVVRVFLNGIDVSSNSLQISVSPTNLQGTKLSIKITVGSKTELRRIWLSWLAFSPATASFGSYGGQVSQSQYSGSVSSDISSSLYQSSYSFLGLNLLSLSSSQAVSFSSAIDINYVLTISATGTVDDFSLVYVSVGVLPKSICANCGAGLIPFQSDCVSSCPANSYSFTYKDGGIACRVCSSKLGFTLVNGKCQQGSATVPIAPTVPSVPVIPSVPSVPSTPTIPSQPATPSTPVQPVTPTQPIQPTISQPTVPAQPVQPTVPVQPVQPTIPATPIQPTVPISAPINCPDNAFYNGNECVCDVGFIFVKGKCQVPAIPSAIPSYIAFPSKPCNDTPVVTPNQQTSSSSSTPAVTSTTSSTSSTSSTASTASTSTSSTSSTASTSSSTTTTPSVPTGTGSTSSSSTSSGASSSSSSSVSCGANSFNNGLGVCICNQGFYFNNGACIAGAACGANSERSSTGACVCITGFTSYNGVCSRCPPGALWSSASSRCIFVCGQNSAYSNSANACVCNNGFGLLNGACQACPQDYFVSNGYCVTCPVNAVYNSASRNCVCSNGFFTNQWGICARKCGTNEQYNPSTQACSCISGLGRINGACQVCPSGSTPTADGSGCSNCKANQILANGVCICQQGFAFNSAGVCTTCSSLSNGFLINGVCAVCPGNMIYNGESCGCPSGKIAQGSLCISQCQNDELLDSEGNCYSCGANQAISNGKCVCNTGYTLNSCGVCELSCGRSQFVFQGTCATCPLNTIYNSAINGCSCPNGFYMDSYGICQQLTLKPVTCPDGQFFDSNLGCQACSATCKTCRSANACITCAASGFVANSQGICTPNCGDGLIIGTETCDSGSSFNAGCINCRIQTGYTCSGQPSVCRQINPTPAPVTPTTPTAPTVPTTPTAPTTPTTPTVPVTPTVPEATSGNLVQVGKVNINSNNVFITLQTNPTFTFANPTEMQNFIQSSFATGAKPTVYCSQRTSPNLNLFDCLLIYPSGVPNRSFTVGFSFNYQGKSGKVDVTVNPLASSGGRSSRNSVGPTA